MEPIDRVGGHIPGAVSASYANHLTAGGEFKPVGELRARFLSLIGDIQPQNMVHYCGSGVTTTINILAMEAAGLEGSKLFPGSWSEWITDPARTMEN